MSDSRALSPGDLAIVIKSVDNLSIGKIVHCVQVDGIDPKFGIIWLISSTSRDLVTEYGGIGRTAHCPQDWLRKIPNDPLPGEDESLTLDKEKDLVD